MTLNHGHDDGVSVVRSLTVEFGVAWTGMAGFLAEFMIIATGYH